MRIIVDVGHPAHVHLFKNFIWEMTKRRHTIRVAATDKDVALQLLTNYGFNFVNFGSYGRPILRKAINIPLMDFKMYQLAKSFKPDLFIGLSPVRAAHVSRILGKPCIAFDDTEHSILIRALYIHFVDVVLTPVFFYKDLGKKQLRYKGCHQLAHLHPNHFNPDPSVIKELGLEEGEKYSVVRFIAWQATHDIGRKGISLDTKRVIVQELEKHGRVLISSEESLPADLQRYQITASPEKILHILYYSNLCISEGGTMASEAAILGTPSILIGPPTMYGGIHKELRDRYGLMRTYSTIDPALEAINELSTNRNCKSKWREKQKIFLQDTIDVTAFMVDLVECYPESVNRYKAIVTR